MYFWSYSKISYNLDHQKFEWITKKNQICNIVIGHGPVFTSLYRKAKNGRPRANLSFYYAILFYFLYVFLHNSRTLLCFQNVFSSSSHLDLLLLFHLHWSSSWVSQFQVRESLIFALIFVFGGYVITSRLIICQFLSRSYPFFLFSPWFFGSLRSSQIHGWYHSIFHGSNFICFPLPFFFFLNFKKCPFKFYYMRTNSWYT